tara:strand:- start:211 stop:558 length:348 start_codon:yes stop_codon:yes gene_type:complete
MAKEEGSGEQSGIQTVIMRINLDGSLGDTSKSIPSERIIRTREVKDVANFKTQKEYMNAGVKLFESSCTSFTASRLIVKENGHPKTILILRPKMMYSLSKPKKNERTLLRTVSRR